MTAPSLTGFAATINFAENTVNATPQLLDSDVTFTDVEGDFNGGSLSLSGLLAEDTASVRNEGAGVGEIGLSGADVTYGGVTIGTLAGGAGATLTITFNAAATSASIDALIQNLTYANSSETPTANRDLLLNVVDASGADLGAIPGTPSFAALTGAANPFNGIDVGRFSAPSFADLDGDGDLDMVVGGEFDTLTVYDNNDADIGFTQLIGATNPLSNIVVGAGGAPSFVDLDGDGDLDLVVGVSDGTLHVYDNNDANTGFTELTGAANPFDGIDVGSDAAPSFVDLDGDDDLDLVVGASDGTLHLYDNNDADAGFTELTGAANPFDGIDVGSDAAPSFVDLDADGDLDLVVGMRNGEFVTYDNNDANAGFTELFFSSSNPFDGIDLGSYSAPSFVDLDGDGDLDLVSGERDGALFSFENTTPRGQEISVTVTAESDAPTLTGFAPTTTFAENTVNAGAQLLDTDVTFSDPNGDLDGGTLSVTGLLAEDTVSVRDEGTGVGEIGLSGADVTYGGVSMGTLAGGVAGVDLTITFNTTATSASIDALIQNLTYANSSDTPTATRDLVLNVTDAAGGDIPARSFVALTGAANPFDGIDVGSNSTPSSVDIDGDGDLDLVVGENDGTLHLFDNNDGDTGFTELTGAANPFDSIDVGSYSAPSFVDLDGDGDLDLVVGASDGKLNVYDNNDADAGFTELTDAVNPFDGIDVGSAAAPSFVDLDDDGDLDLVVGASDGTLHLYDNNDGDTGFTELTGAANPFDGIDVGSDATPSFGDLDRDGDLDLVVGDSSGTFRVYDNNDGDTGFTQLTGEANPFDNVDVGLQSTPTSLIDLDDDGDLDLVSGGVFGRLFSFENTTPLEPRITVTVTAENDAPTLTGFASSITIAENTVNATPQLLDSDVTFADAEGNFDGGSLSLTGVLAEDTVSLRNQGTGVGEIGLNGANVTYGGVTIGTLAGGAGAALAITFNAAATSASVDALIQNLTYANSSDTPTASRDLVLNVIDAASDDLGIAPGTPSFVALTGGANPLNGIDAGSYSAPSFVDLDGDGDLDLVVGTNDGIVKVYDNNDADAGFTELTGAANVLGGIVVGTRSAPSFVDLDDDGDLDVVVGNSDGTLNVFDNNDADAGFTELTGAANVLAGIDVGYRSTPSFVDLDGDGDLDLVVGDDLGTFKSFDNNDADTGFTALTGAANPFDGIDVGLYAAPTFVDLDGDGDLDLVSGASDGTLRVFDNNDGDTGFTELTGVANPWNGVVFNNNTTPSFVDLDGDGDLDLVSGASDGTFATFENSALRGNVITVTVLPTNDAPILTGFAPSVSFAENTVNTTPQLLDVDVIFTDGEGDFDGGSLSLSGLLAQDTASVRNEGVGAGEIGLSGANVTYSGVTIGTLAGGAGTTLSITFNAAATSASIDALIQNLTYANSSDTPTANHDLLLNVVDASGDDLGALPGTPSFAALTGAANPFNGIDVGYRSAPSFVDLDGDGDLDAVFASSDGTLRTYDSNNADSGFTELTGAANPLDGINGGIVSAPSFADLDGDGDLDLIIGSYDGTLRVFDNNDADAGFSQLTGAANPLDGIDVGNDSAPTFVDLDGDGDLDLVVGGFFGALQLFDNNDADDGFTELTGAANPFDSFAVGTNSTPTFVDLDGDGDLDLVVGEYFGTLKVFDNNDADDGFTALTGAANPFDGIDVGSNSAPSFVDLDGDGDLDLVVGEYTGTVVSFENTTPRGQVIAVTVTAENDAPTLTGLPTLITVNEALADDVDLSGITLADPDEDQITVTISATSGQLDAVSSGGVLVQSSGSDTLVMSGTALALNAFLQDVSAVQFTGPQDVFGTAAATLTISTTDLLSSAIIQGTVQVDITDVVTQPGTSGNDTLNGSSSADILIGDAGNDILNGGADADTLSGGTGIDWLQYAASSAGISVDLNVVAGFQSASGGDATGDVISGFENVSGSIHADTLTGNDQSNYLIGRAGNDVLAGGDGNDVLRGGTDADTLSGGDGIDWVQYIDSFAGVTVDLNGVAGFQLATGGDATGDVISGFERVSGSNHADALTGNDEDNILLGRAGNDVLTGGAGSDILNGGAGNDILNGGAGADTLTGASGIDWAKYNGSSAGVMIDLSVIAGFQSASGGDAAGDVISGFENVSGSASADTLTGNNGNNYLIGRAGNDVLTGGDGNDILRGGTDADTLAGGNGIDWVQYIDSSAGVTVDLNSIAGFQSASGADATGDVISGFERVGGSNHADTLTGNDEDNYLIGRAGSDVLMGGGGNDVLHGGTGADTFIFNSDDGSDQINGGGDSDTVLFTGFDSTDFTIVDLAGSNWTVTEIATGDFDTLTSIEVLAFDDLMLSV